jgi:type VI protein secretion system component Hcp
MAVDMFINIGDLKREAQDKKPQDEIDVVSWSWEYQIAARRIFGGGAGSENLPERYPAKH